MIDRSIVSLVLDSALMAMSVKQHFDIKKLSKGVAELLGNLDPEHTRESDLEFSRILQLLRLQIVEDEFDALLALMSELTPPERNMLRAIVAGRPAPSKRPTQTTEVLHTFSEIDKERIDFLAELSRMKTKDALAFLRTGVGITPEATTTGQAARYARLIGDFVSTSIVRLGGWIKTGALKTHATIFESMPVKQSLLSVILGKLLLGGTDGDSKLTPEAEFLNELFARFENKGDVK